VTIRSVLALVALVFIAPLRAVAQTAPTLDEILTMPLSPGSVALLVGHVTQPAAAARLGAALRDPNANVRAAAARVSFVGGIRGMANPVMVALAQETSLPAAVEEIRLLVHFGTDVHRKAIEEAVARFGERVVASTAIELAVNEGPAVIARLPLFRAADAGKETLSRVIRMATKNDRAALERVVRDALTGNDAVLMAAALDAAILQRVFDLPEPLLLSTVTHTMPALSIEGVWYLAQSWDGKKPWSPAVLRGMQSALDAQVASPSAGVRFAREIVARLRGAPPAVSPEWQTLLSSGDISMMRLVTRPFAIDVLTNREFDVAARGIGSTAKALKDIRERTDPPKPKAAPRNALVVPFLEAASGYPPEFASDVFKVSGCLLSGEGDRTKSDGAEGGFVALRTDGRPASISMLGSRVAQPACVTAAQTLLRSAVGYPPETAEPQASKTVLIPFESSFFACQDRSFVAPGPPRQIQGEGVERPTKTVNVPPTYPQSAIDDRVQGIVILEAVISHEGCITSARVLRGLDGRLDWAAVRAVIQWRFTPTLLNGVAVPVIMTVTVQFSLS